MAVFPGGVATNADLYIALDNFHTTLNGAINNSQTTITLVSTTGLPTVGILTIESEKVKYTGVAGNDITGVTRGFSGTTAVSHLSGAAVRLLIVEELHNNSKDEIIAIETFLFGVPFASKALDNLASVAINAALNPAVDDAIDLNIVTKRFKKGFFSSDVTLSHLFTGGSTNPALPDITADNDHTTGIFFQGGRVLFSGDGIQIAGFSDAEGGLVIESGYDINMGSGSQILADDGNAGAPGFASTGHPDSGIWFTSSIMALSVDGTTYVDISSSDIGQGSGGIIMEGDADLAFGTGHLILGGTADFAVPDISGGNGGYGFVDTGSDIGVAHSGVEVGRWAANGYLAIDGDFGTPSIAFRDHPTYGFFYYDGGGAFNPGIGWGVPSGGIGAIAGNLADDGIRLFNGAYLVIHNDTSFGAGDAIFFGTSEATSMIGNQHEIGFRIDSVGLDQRFLIDDAGAAGETNISVWDVTGTTLQRVSIGVAHSGGVGFRLLRIPN